MVRKIVNLTNDLPVYLNKLASAEIKFQIKKKKKKKKRGLEAQKNLLPINNEKRMTFTQKRTSFSSLLFPSPSNSIAPFGSLTLIF